MALPTAVGAQEDRPVLDFQHQGPIKVVYQVTADEELDGVSKGLSYLKRLRQQLIDQGIDADRIDIRAVFHGQASFQLLTDETHDRLRKRSGGNPNSALIAELNEAGIRIEFCDFRRQELGWEKSDVHPDVTLVRGAFARLVDLQLQGYAYIRF
ncbi:MAG TPA: hypothetical protein DCQ98_11070 [Planctomycetaceae bacterium]|nr:hypothetical protein [Planctomycetaceae bacterium]HRF00216.1 DsrE family protein [Pirellulaceae bacterium]